jgi:hypothetical protein
MKTLLCLAALAAFPLVASAQTSAGTDVRPFLSLGLTGGGDTFDQFVYSDGTTKSVKAGGLIQFSFGVDVGFGGPFSAQVSVGYHADNASGSDGTYTFSRTPIEVLGHWRINEQLRVGGGIRSALNPKIVSEGSLAGSNKTFTSSAGLVLEGEFFARRNLGLKLRLVNERYQDQAAPYRTINASHVGVFANLYFR